MTAARRGIVLAIALALSGLADALGGLWGVFDWAGVSGFMAGVLPDWAPIGRAARRGLEDEALRQLWANLGSALVALGAAQGMAAWWVRQARPEGFTLARVIGLTLVVAAGLMSGPGGQLSSLATEGARGAALWWLAVWATPRDR